MSQDEWHFTSDERRTGSVVQFEEPPNCGNIPVDENASLEFEICNGWA